MKGKGVPHEAEGVSRDKIATPHHRKLEPKERIPAALSLQDEQGSRIYLVLIKKCTGAQVLLHPKGSAARRYFAPREAKPLCFFFFFLAFTSCAW